MHHHAGRHGRRVGRLALLVAVILTGGAGCASSTGTATGAPPAQVTAAAAPVRHLDPAAFAALVAQQGTVVLDVRTPAEYSAGHLPGARNLDLQGDFARRVATLDHAASYAIYCHSGNRSATAGQMMAAAGFTTVADLAGGLTAWAAAGKPVVTS